MTFIFVCLGGIFGAIGRYLVSIITTKHFSPSRPYVSTLIVNGIGSFALGIMVNLFEGSLHNSMLIGITGGVIGSFTTYSTFALDCIKFIRDKKWASFCYYLVGTFILSIGLFSVGLYIL